MFRYQSKRPKFAAGALSEGVVARDYVSTSWIVDT
jgi:hypothetical protein